MISKRHKNDSRIGIDLYYVEMKILYHVEIMPVEMDSLIIVKKSLKIPGKVLE